MYYFICAPPPFDFFVQSHVNPFVSKGLNSTLLGRDRNDLEDKIMGEGHTCDVWIVGFA